MHTSVATMPAIMILLCGTPPSITSTLTDIFSTSDWQGHHDQDGDKPAECGCDSGCNDCPWPALEFRVVGSFDCSRDVICGQHCIHEEQTNRENTRGCDGNWHYLFGTHTHNGRERCLVEGKKLQVNDCTASA